VHTNKTEKHQPLLIIYFTGWEMRVDDRTNWPFFIDHNTQTTTWTDPRPFKEAKVGLLIVFTQQNVRLDGSMRDLRACFKLRN